MPVSNVNVNVKNCNCQHEAGSCRRDICAAAQVYELSCQFLPKEWIMEKWEEGYYITAMAGSHSGSSLVVMSKGTPYTQQSYKVLLLPFPPRILAVARHTARHCLSCQQDLRNHSQCQCQCQCRCQCHGNPMSTGPDAPLMQDCAVCFSRYKYPSSIPACECFICRKEVPVHLLRGWLRNISRNYAPRAFRCIQ